MHPAYANPKYPNYGQPYHAYVPPGYPHHPFPAVGPSQDPYRSPPQGQDQWNREKYAYQQPLQGHTRPPPSANGSQNFPFIPPHPDAIPGPHTPMPRLKRASTGRPVQTSEKPFQPKSAMKKPRRANSVAVSPLERTRTTSDPRQRLAPMTRSRTNSNPSYQPDHLFVSFHGSNELRMRNVAFQDTLDEIKENLVPMWPHGISSQSTTEHSWRVGFSRNPWSASGMEGIIVQKMICELFTRLSRQGYQYLTSLNTGYPSPQLVFQDREPDDYSEFFVAHFSRSGHKMTLIRPPRRIGESIGPRLRNAWPYKIAADRASEDEIYTVELKRNALGAPELDKNVFAAHALQEINLMGYRLEATVCLARSGILGFGSKKEIWVFRGTRIRARADSRSGRA